MTALGDAMVNVPLRALDELREDRARLTARITKLELELAARGEDVLSRHAPAMVEQNNRLREALDLSVEIACWMIGNVAPHEARGWPFAKVRELGKALEAFPQHHEIIATWREICGEAEACEIARAQNKKPAHVATGADWQAGAEAFEREFGVKPDAYKKGGLAGVLAAQAEAQEKAEKRLGEDDALDDPLDSGTLKR